jgi:HKD family nuclease
MTTDKELLDCIMSINHVSGDDCRDVCFDSNPLDDIVLTIEDYIEFAEEFDLEPLSIDFLKEQGVKYRSETK